MAQLKRENSQKHEINASGAKVKTVMITAPDGNHIAFAEAIDQSMGR